MSGRRARRERIDAGGELDPLGLTRGPKVYASPDAHAQARQRFDEAERRAELAGAHLWHAIATYLLDDPDREPMLLDTENMGGVYVGCYRCEQPYRPGLKGRPCPGEPVHP